MFGGIREMFTDPEILRQKKETAEKKKEQHFEQMTSAEKEEFERKKLKKEFKDLCYYDIEMNRVCPV